MNLRNAPGFGNAMLSLANSGPLQGCMPSTNEKHPARMTEQVYKTLEEFFSHVEKRAFRIAEIGTQNRDDALELVQEAMTTLVKNYSRKPQPQWAPLFYRILRNKITDWHRRQQVRNKLMMVSNWFRHEDSNSEEEWIANSPAEQQTEPDSEVHSSKTTEIIMDALKQLPPRQQQAFMLRAWEGLSISETAFAMGCTEGSVKTHFSRATQRLQSLLGTMKQFDGTDA